MVKAAVVATLLLLAAAAQAGGPAPAHHEKHGHKRASRADWEFMQRVAATGRAAIAASALLQREGTRSPVRAFAVRVEHEDEALESRLALLSLFTQVPLPARAAAEDDKALRGLGQQAGPALDRGFLDEAEALDLRLIALLQREAAATSADPGLRSLAREFLPRVQAQLDTARELRAQARS